MQRKLFWSGLIAISLLCSFTFSFVTGTLLTLGGGFVWWWVVYRSDWF